MKPSPSVARTFTTRRSFLQTLGLAGASFGLPFASPAEVADLDRAAANESKSITYLEDGGFQAQAWGWQFTQGARIDKSAGPEGLGSVHVKTVSGAYARFLVLGPVEGETYTLSGWVRTQSIETTEHDCGAYFAASQFEFQGRPTEFTVDGKQATESRQGNFTGTQGWQRFSHTVQCLATTSWFEIVLGIYRASGDAWFSGVTFVKGKTPVPLERTMLPREASALAHWDLIASAGRTRPRAAVLNEPDLPVRGARTSATRLQELLRSTHDVEMLTATQLADPLSLNRKRFDLLVLGCGESFPLTAKKTVSDFLADGGDLFTTGGYAFQSPVVMQGGKWAFYEDVIKDMPAGKNLLPALDEPSGWKCTDATRCTMTSTSAWVHVAAPLRKQKANWTFDLPATGDGKQFEFTARWRTRDVQPAPDGCASIGVQQLDAAGSPAYAARLDFDELRGTSDWKTVRKIFYLVPDCVLLRVQFGLENATGEIEVTDVRLASRPDQFRMNTALGWPEDSLRVNEKQIGIFDADYRLRRVAALRTVPVDGSQPIETTLDAQGYAASGVVGMDAARWVPLLQTVDLSGRVRGAAGALMRHSNGYYARSAWAFFGVGNHDILKPECKAGVAACRTALRALASKCYLHALETEYATYHEGEPVRSRALLSNYGFARKSLSVTCRITAADEVVFTHTADVMVDVGDTLVLENVWKPTVFDAAQYEVSLQLRESGEVTDTLKTAFNVWKAATLQAGMPMHFHDNYFHVQGKPVFLQGTDDYLHTFIDQDENPGTWRADAQGCRDNAIDVYENLMGLRGPQQRPTETWWRWVDAMLLNTQQVGGIFFPGMLVFSNTAVSDADLEDQKAYVRAFAERYRDAAGIMYYLNGDLELHDPNLPDLQALYNAFLLKKYGSDESLRAAWKLAPPEASIGALKIKSGTTAWQDVRTHDDFRFRTELVRRWLNAMHDSIREVDSVHPVTAEFYQEPVSGIDLLTALGKLELANFGYFAEKDRDYYRFPQVCRFLDQRLLGKGINVGEFGVKTHPAWNDTGYYIEARSETYEQQYFLSLSHYAFGLGASKIQNWCWKYPADLPFEWGINYPNELVPRDVRAFYRNSGILFRALRPKYQTSDTVVLLASEARMGGQGMQIVEGQLNAIRLLLDRNISFQTLTDDFISSLPADVKTIFYPLPYCPSDAVLEYLTAFVKAGGQLYLSGDISYDSHRQRTRYDRLLQLCGVVFVSERYAALDYGNTAVLTSPTDDEWPKYMAAPTLIVRPAGASVLLAGVDGHPIVTEFVLGRGRVVLSLDPVELHGDAQFHRYAHRFYQALLTTFSIEGEKVGGAKNIHSFRVPALTGPSVQVFVNHGTDSQTLQHALSHGTAEITLTSHLPGVLAETSSGGIRIVESSGNVLEDGFPLISADCHAMVMSLDQEALRSSKSVLVLPMSVGTFTLHSHHRFIDPVLLMGEIVGGRWTQFAEQKLEAGDTAKSFKVDAERCLSMLILCESKDAAEVARLLEVLMNTPWKIEDTP